MLTLSPKTRTLVLCLTLAFSAVILSAAGQAEPRLAEAQRLIQQQNYTEALKLLVAIQRADPALRDKTSSLIEQIMAVARRYNQVLDQLNGAIASGNPAEIESLSAELRRVDPARAEVDLQRVQLAAGFLDLMNAAQRMLQDDKPLDALNRYLLAFTDPARAGFRLPRTEFDSAGYGDIITGTAKAAVDRMLSTTRQEVAAAPSVSSALAAATAVLTRPPAAERETELASAEAPFLEAAAAEGTVREAAAAILEVNRSIQRSTPKGRVDPYLFYVTTLFLGRANQSEGIAYALRQLWAPAAQAVARTALDSLSRSFDQAQSRYRSGSLEAADAELRSIPAQSSLAVQAASVASARLDVTPENHWNIPHAEAASLQDLLGMALEAQQYTAQAEGYRLLIGYRRDLAGMPRIGAAATGGGPELAVLTSARTTLDGRLREVRSQESSWNGRAQHWESAAGTVTAASALARSSRDMAGLFRAFAESDLRPRDLQYALRIARLAGAGFTGRLEDARAQVAQAADLKDGTVNGAPAAAGTLPQKHPDQALTVLASAGKALDSLVADVAAEEQRLRSEKDYVKETPEYAALLQGSPTQTGYVTLLDQARSERDKVATLSDAARKQVDAAALASREGDNAWAQAEAALQRGDPDVASSSLLQATAAYLSSLAQEYTEHAAARTTTDAAKLNGDILNLQNRISVANAQKQITVINQLVAQKDYLRASDTLDAAVRAWSQTQEGTYPPFDNLRQTIRAALELSQGREISRYDPKADVVNAFIKNAQDNLAAGRLTDAMRNVRDALAVAPNYGAAKVLELQIRKQTDPAGFEREAQAQIATYLKMGADSTNKEGQQTAYLALLDYSTLDPKFAAQLKGPIQELEYALGLARRPPTAAQISRANALVQRARLVQQQGTDAAYQQALGLLKQALQINPDNTEAIRLDGRIRTAMGSTALSELSPADTQVFNQAFSQYLSGAYQDAYDRVTQLWNAPRNRTYPPLQQLKKRLEVQLNIS